MIKLKPCPFCGNEEPVIKIKTLSDGKCDYDVKYIVCEICGARTMERICDGYYGGFCSDYDIAALWNKRANNDVDFLYLCDRKACENCHDECNHTSDIEHAIHRDGLNSRKFMLVRDKSHTGLFEID